MDGEGDGPAALVDVHHLGLQATGNESWSRNVVRALEADGGRPVDYVLTARGPAALPVPVDPRRLHLVGGSSTRRLLLDLPRVLRRLGPEVVLAQYTLPLSRVPGCVVIHDLSFEDPRAREWIPPRRLVRYRATIRASARRARSVIVSSQWTRDDLLRHYGTDPATVVVCPIAVDEDLLKALEGAARARAEAVRDEPVVLCVGGVLPRKNLPVVARAVRELRASGIAAVLRVVGSVPDAGRADAALLRELLGPAVSFSGHVSQDQLAAEYAAATAVAYASRYEGFGIPLIEAMAAGLPVVSSDATCLPEVGGDAALYADPDDVHGWADALTRVLSDVALRRQLTVRGDQRVALFRQTDAAAAVRRALVIAAGAAG